MDTPECCLLLAPAAAAAAAAAKPKRTQHRSRRIDLIVSSTDRRLTDSEVFLWQWVQRESTCMRERHGCISVHHCTKTCNAITCVISVSCTYQFMFRLDFGSFRREIRAFRLDFGPFRRQFRAFRQERGEIRGGFPWRSSRAQADFRGGMPISGRNHPQFQGETPRIPVVSP